MIALSRRRNFKHLVSLATLLSILTLAITGVLIAMNVESAKAAAITIYVNATSGSDIDGLGTAARPYKSVTKGMDTAVSGQTVSVASGMYNELYTSEKLPINLKSGVILQGAGDSSTFIQGTHSSSIVTASNVNASAKIDGFTIMGGTASYGGGIYLYASSPTISNNAIMANTANSYGGGIFCEMSSSPTISNNSINQNTAGLSGGGISCSSSSPTILRNDIRVNTGTLSGGGIYCTSSSPTISNNTITDNSGGLTGGGIDCSNLSYPTISNNTIVANGATFGGGIACASSVPTVFNCIVWGNGDDLFGCAATYSDIENGDAGTGNISVYPMFNPGYGDYHLGPRSPCIDAGTNTGAPTNDIEGYSRPRDGDANGSSLTDMGAYEFTNTGPFTINVSPDGSDTTGNGAAYYPFRSITKGMSVALAGDAVAVAAGTYNAANSEVFPISLKTGVALQGAGALTTTIQGSGPNPVVRALTTIDASAVIDGFTITGGNSADYGGGIRCWNSSPTITNNIISGNSASIMGGGISCFNSANSTISNNIIIGNSAPGAGGDGGGICVYASSPIISRNTISGNSAGSMGGGIICSNGAAPIISNNIIAGNSAMYGGGLSCGSSPIVSNNTISGNTAGDAGGGIYNLGGSPNIFNCIVWGNNDDGFYGCSATYSDIQGGGAGAGNIAVDPLFANAAGGNYHLRAGSLCINSGTGAGAPTTDKNGVLRPQGSGYDMGAYEYEPNLPFDHINLSPGSSDVMAKTQYGLDAEAVDVYDVELAGAGYAWSAAAGMLSAATGGTISYTTPRKVGTYQVTLTASAGGATKTATASYTVLPGTIHHVHIRGLAAVTAGQSRIFTAAEHDQFSNPIGTPSYAWTLPGSGGSLDTASSIQTTFTAGSTPGGYTLRLNGGSGHIKDQTIGVIPVIDSDNKRFVKALYWVGLERSPEDPGDTGPNYWTGLVDAGIDRTTAATAITFSHESHRKIIENMYYEMFNRCPAWDDPVDTGWPYWTGLMDAGISRRSIKASFYGSAEFTGKASNTAELIDILYYDVLGRDPEPGGRDYWASMVDSGNISPSQFASMLTYSDEYASNFIKGEYMRVLGRGTESDPGGLAFWIASMAAGTPEEALTNLLYGSNEFYDKFKRR